MAVARDRAPAERACPGGIPLRALQRPHRPARQPRRGRAVRHPRHLPQLLLRAASTAVRRSRLQLSRVRPDARRCDQRQADPLAGGRFTARRPVRRTAFARAPPRFPWRDVAPGARLDRTGWQADQGPVQAPGLVDPARGRGDRVRRGGGRPAGPAGRAVRTRRERDPAPVVRRSARLRSTAEPVGRGRAGCRFRGSRAGASDPGEWTADGRGNGASGRVFDPDRGGRRRPGGLGPEHDHLRAAAGGDPAGGEVHRLRLVESAVGHRGHRPGLGSAGGGQVLRLGRSRRAAADLPGRLLGRRRREGRGQSRTPAGSSVRLVPCLAVGRPGGTARYSVEGPDRRGVRRPYLLGHRRIRAAGPDADRAGRGRRRVALAAHDVAVGKGSSGRARSAGRGLSLADDPGSGVLGVLAGRYRRVPPGCRHRRGDRSLSQRHR